ncbi:MAG TPA: hypothetical protein ENN22_09315 [bacterium]|nr:hypothetical protein [bacterium]
MGYQSIITHNDFDGVASAAICSFVFKIDLIKFSGPNTIANAEITITENDIVCDLPYPLICGLWFDHHEGNLHELKFRNIDPESIPGKFDIQPSCARVVFDYFSGQVQFPEYFKTLVDETDIIDSFNYQSIDDWRKQTPAKIIDATIRLRNSQLHDKRRYLKMLALEMQHRPLSVIAENEAVQQYYQQYLDEEKEMLELIRRNSEFVAADKQREIIVLDLTGFNRPPYLIKNLAYLLYPEVKAVLEIKPIFKNHIKTNNLSFSLSLSLNMNTAEHNKDVGEIMRELNIGDGHKGAAAGTVRCRSRNEMLKQKQIILNRIFELWHNQE